MRRRSANPTPAPAARGSENRRQPGDPLAVRDPRCAMTCPIVPQRSVARASPSARILATKSSMDIPGAVACPAGPTKSVPTARSVTFSAGSRPKTRTKKGRPKATIFRRSHGSAQSLAAFSFRYEATPAGESFMPLSPLFQPAGQTSPCSSWNCRASTMRIISSILRPRGRLFTT